MRFIMTPTMHWCFFIKNGSHRINFLSQINADKARDDLFDEKLLGYGLGLSFLLLSSAGFESRFHLVRSVTSKNSPNVYKSCPKNDFTRKT